MKFWLILLFLLSLSTLTQAQSCGYTFLTIYLIDSKGQTIKGAEVKTFKKDFTKEDLLHYPQMELGDRPPRKEIGWWEAKGAYFGGEGMCGGHRDVGLRISAKGFETFDKIIDLPLGWTSYRIKLKQTGTIEVAGAVSLFRYHGKVMDENKAVIPFAGIEFRNENGRKHLTRSDNDGRFEANLPIENYTVTVSKAV